jgi:hypothetical protein
MPEFLAMRKTLENKLFRGHRSHRSVALAFASAVVLLSDKAFAYRPFDGTDADVAKEGEFELELGPVHYLRQNGASYVLAPATVLNLGIFSGAELVFDSKNLIPNEQVPGASRFQFIDQDVLVKLVLHKGILQGGQGVSAAVETGPLLPGIHSEPGMGASANLILSYQWEPLTLHFNNQLSDTREHVGDYFSSLIIVAGPDSWRVRPVAEFFGERTFGASTQFSGLFGVIYYANRKIDVDFAFREASVDDQPVTEIRLGITWRIDLWGAEGLSDDDHDEENRDPDPDAAMK